MREWADRVGVNLSQKGVGFVAMGGVRNFTHFAAEATVSFLAKRRVRLWFVMDRDEREWPELRRLEERLGGRATLKVLRKRELENYLLVPRAIAELARAKKRMSGGGELTTTEDEIRGFLDEGAEELKAVAIEKRVVRRACKAIHPDTRSILTGNGRDIVQRVGAELEALGAQLASSKGEIAAIAKEEREGMEGRWAGSKLDLVPGDMLLDLVMKRFGLRFRKERDSVRLAGLMRDHEIDPEIRELLKELGS
jgi:hypothetical protein